MPETVDLSPYAEDGVQDRALSLELRVPIISTPYPRWCYITAVVAGGWPWHESPEITDAELRMVGSFHDEYVSYWYRQSGRWWTEMQARPFDLDGGAVGRYLTKYENGGWGYRISTWEYGPLFAPSLQSDPMPLASVLDRVHSHGGATDLSPRWTKWKAEHRDIFGGES